VYKVNVTLGKGVNTIRITALEDGGLSIDALKVN